MAAYPRCQTIRTIDLRVFWDARMTYTMAWRRRYSGTLESLRARLRVVLDTLIVQTWSVQSNVSGLGWPLPQV
jgi:hypothetical protein